MANASKQPPIRSRRRAKLRVVGTETFPRRAAAFTAPGSFTGKQRHFVVEVLTFDEYDKLPEALRPSGQYHILPGIGWLIFSDPINDEEIEDVRDANRLARELWDAERTPAW
jgi:hypothetical protein